MSWDLHLITFQVSHVSIQVPIHESDIQIPILGFPRHPGYVLPSPQSRDWHFNLIQVPPDFHQGPDICILPQSMSLNDHFPTLVTSHLHPGHETLFLSQSMSWYLHLNTIQLMPHMHPCPEILHLHHIQVSRHAPHLHPGPVRLASRSQDSHLASLHVASHFYMDLTTMSAPRIAFTSRSHPTYIQVSRCVSPPTRSCLTSIQVPISTSHLHPGHISTPIQVKTIAYHFHPGPFSPSAKTWYSCLISSQVSIFVSHHSGHISLPSKFRKLHLSFIQVPSHPIQAPRFVSHLHQGPISLPSIYQNLHLTCIQVPSHLHSGPKIFISPLCHVSPPFKSPGLHLGPISLHPGS